MEKLNLIAGDSAEELKQYEDGTFDSVVTDPPYGIEFLGKDWDKNTGAIEVWKECLRVLKPGGHLLAFSAARTYHRLATNLEDVGFEIRDQIMWIYGSGFPKGQDMGKLIEKREGKRKAKKPTLIPYDKTGVGEMGNIASGHGKCPHCLKDRVVAVMDIQKKGECSTPQCEFNEIVRPADNEWSGWKTGLKPAHEPIVMARKPFKGSTVDNVLNNGVGAINIDDTRVGTEKILTDHNSFSNNILNSTKLNEHSKETYTGRYPANVIGEIEGEEQKYFYKPELTEEEVHNPIVMARKPFKGSTVDNVLKHGTGAINIDDCRIVPDSGDSYNQIVPGIKEGKKHGIFNEEGKEDLYANRILVKNDIGRYPANVIMSEEEGKILDEKTGVIKSVGAISKKKRKEKPDNSIYGIPASEDPNTNPYLNEPPRGASKYYYCPKVSRKERNVGCDMHEPITGKDVGPWSETGERLAVKLDKMTTKHNNHPTVKPVALMKYLVTLVTPKGGKVLDPFNGSGSTGMAVKEFGGEYVGIDLDPDYIEISRKRIEAWDKKDEQ